MHESDFMPQYRSDSLWNFERAGLVCYWTRPKRLEMAWSTDVCPGGLEFEAYQRFSENVHHEWFRICKRIHHYYSKETKKHARVFEDVSFPLQKIRLRETLLSASAVQLPFLQSMNLETVEFFKHFATTMLVIWQPIRSIPRRSKFVPHHKQVTCRLPNKSLNIGSFSPEAIDSDNGRSHAFGVHRLVLVYRCHFPRVDWLPWNQRLCEFLEEIQFWHPTTSTNMCIGGQWRWGMDSTFHSFHNQINVNILTLSSPRVLFLVISFEIVLFINVH